MNVYIFMYIYKYVSDQSLWLITPKAINNGWMELW
jgi:hypothetical protein